MIGLFRRTDITRLRQLFCSALSNGEASRAVVASPYVDRWLVGVVLLCGLFFAPVLALVITASGDSGGLWTHLLDTVLGTYVFNTLGIRDTSCF